MSIPDFDRLMPGNPLEDVLKSFAEMQQKDVAVTAELDSKGVDLNKLINDHIYGLLSLDELSATQVDLLAALLGTKGY
jgi:hypothetical protein